MSPARRYGLFTLLALFGVSTALVVWMAVRILHDGPFSFGGHNSLRGGATFRASAVLPLAILSVSTGYVLINELRDYLQARRRKRIRNSPNSSDTDSR